ncbi:MAG: imidazoleglycerol-phosphate dehydratase HisB [Chloroflexi bacterium]|nr:imidazoleglycerol-phosphate dehydratase HisB [Chloroflexota bacterium]
MADRRAQMSRETGETSVQVSLNLDGTGSYVVETGSEMLDHLLSQLSRHSGFDLTVKATAQRDPDGHHRAEDVAIVLGRALDRALGERVGVRRMGDATVPLDEALALVAVDLGGRGYAVVEASFATSHIGDLRSELVHHVLESFAREGRFTLHVRVLAGFNDHHKAEAVFKALAKALAWAASQDERMGGIPSTKGTLS